MSPNFAGLKTSAPAASSCLTPPIRKVRDASSAKEFAKSACS
jgi:hypothetical protein